MNQNLDKLNKIFFQCIVMYSKDERASMQYKAHILRRKGIRFLCIGVLTQRARCSCSSGLGHNSMSTMVLSKSFVNTDVYMKV